MFVYASLYENFVHPVINDYLGSTFHTSFVILARYARTILQQKQKHRSGVNI